MGKAAKLGNTCGTAELRTRMCFVQIIRKKYYSTGRSERMFRSGRTCVRYASDANYTSGCSSGTQTNYHYKSSIICHELKQTSRHQAWVCQAVEPTAVWGDIRECSFDGETVWRKKEKEAIDRGTMNNCKREKCLPLVRHRHREGHMLK